MEAGTDGLGGGGNTPGTNRSLPDDLDRNEDIESQLGGQLGSEGLEKSQDEWSVQEPTPANDIDDCQLHEHDNLHAGENFSRSLFEARWTSSRLTSLSLPWETGVMSQIFGLQPVQQIPRVEPLLNAEALATMSSPGPSAVVTEPAGQTLDKPLYEIAVKCHRGFYASTTDKWDKAMRKWLCILYQNLDASDVGLQIAATDTEQEAISWLSKVFGGKSENTVHKRANCMKRFIAWVVKEDSSRVAIPFDSKVVTDYMWCLNTMGKYGSIIEFVETLAFCFHVVGIRTNFEIDSNVVLKGLLRSARVSRKETKQSRPLTVKEVHALEDALIMKRGNKVDLFGIGVFLFRIYARARVSDIRNIHSLEVDITNGHGYIEAKTFDHKSKRLLGSLGLSLLLIAPINGVHRQSWGLSFIEAGKDVGIDLTRGIKGPLLPAVGPGGEWLSRAVTSDETTTWLNLLITRVLGEKCSDGLTSHGLKATCLSWMAKAGYDDNARLILGHHSLSGKRSLEAYSRDMQSAPLRHLDSCIKSVRDGHFLPDMTRSGQFANVGEPAAVASTMTSFGRDALRIFSSGMKEAEHHSKNHDVISVASSLDQAVDLVKEDVPEDIPNLFEEKQDLAVESSDESDSSYESSSESDTAIETLAHEHGISSLSDPNVWKEGCTVFQNSKTKMLHLQAVGSSSKTLVCGRVLNDCMKDVTGKFIVSNGSRCKQCEAGRPIRDQGAMASFLDLRLKQRRTDA